MLPANSGPNVNSQTEGRVEAAREGVRYHWQGERGHVLRIYAFYTFCQDVNAFQIPVLLSIHHLAFVHGRLEDLLLHRYSLYRRQSRWSTIDNFILLQ